MKHILYVTLMGVILFVTLSIGFIYIKGYDKPYVLGEIIVGLKPYTTKNKVNEFIRAHPEISIKRENPSSIPSYATLSLKPHSEWLEKVITWRNRDPEGEALLLAELAKLKRVGREDTPSYAELYNEWDKKVTTWRNKDPQMRNEILRGEALLHAEYERLKSEPLLLRSSISDSSFLPDFMEETYFASIGITFKRGVSREERESFFQRYPQLEIVSDTKESSTALIKVPKRKEQYWINEFLKQDFVRYAEFNSKVNIKRSVIEGKGPLEMLLFWIMNGFSTDASVNI